jgi:hypothetical protein
VRSELEHAIKNEIAALEENISPVPAIVLHNIVCLCFDPKVERDQRNATDPTEKG